MRGRRAIIAGVLVSGLAVIAYIMRGGGRPSYVAPPVQLGLADGAVETLAATDAAVPELRELARSAARALEAR